MIVRVTTIEAFRRVVETEYGNEQELIDRIRGIDKPTPAMLAGTAWHKALETGTATRPAMCQEKTSKGNVYPSEAVAEAAASMLRAKTGDQIEPFLCNTCRQWHNGKATGHEDDLGNVYVDGFCFSKTDVESARKVQGPGQREIAGRKQFGDVTVTGTCDHLRGLTIRDAKAKFSTIDAKDYEPSLQWRFYLSLFECDRFIYDLFAFKPEGEGGLLEVRETASFAFWRYPGMDVELHDWAARFASWAEFRGLAGQLGRIAA